VPDAELVRAYALSHSMVSIGVFVGPSIGVGLVSAGSASMGWLMLGMVCGRRRLVNRWRGDAPGVGFVAEQIRGCLPGG
jgi:hypothetical protein